MHNIFTNILITKDRKGNIIFQLLSTHETDKEISVNMKQYISLPTILKGCSALATIYFLTIRKFSQNIH